MLGYKFFAISAIVTFSSACLAQSAMQPPLWSAKPDAAAFEKIENHYLDAAQRDIDTITALKGARTIDNTLVPYDDAVRNLDSASSFAGVMQQVHPQAAFRDKAEEMTRKVGAANNALSLNPEVYHALAALDLSKADPATRHYVTRRLLQYRLAGVDKDEATRTRLENLNDQLVDLQSKFDRNISDDKRSVKLDSAQELDGLPADFIARHKSGTDGKITITTDYPDVFPVIKFANNTELRRKILTEFQSRAYPANQTVLTDMIRVRYDIAHTLGYNSWADYNAADSMIAGGQQIAKFIHDLDEADRPIADREFQMLLAEKRKVDPKATDIESYSASYYTERLRRAQYDFDFASVRPYFPYASVKQAILDMAQKLFQLSFTREANTVSWDPSVETWDVFDHGKMIGRFYLDMHPREGKYSHAEMAPVLEGIRGKQLPEAVLVCNFPAPTADDPGLMEFNDVKTFFHEFGHLMHWILGGNQQWAGISGISMESDFVEAPSQMLENWIDNPSVLRSFAKHYKTGEPIPADLVARMERAFAFGRGSRIAGQTQYTATSYDIYAQDPAKVNFDQIFFDDARKYTNYPEIAGTHGWASFGHLAGYSSAYYTYMWDLVIAQDFYSQFDQNDPLSGDVPSKYRKAVLEPGGSESANDLVKNFLGRPQNTRAFQTWMSQEFEESKSATQAGRP